MRAAGELLRYLAVGGGATLVHFAMLAAGVRAGIEPVGLANFVAAVFGSACAFLGNRYVVFPGSSQPVTTQLARFAGVYLAAAIFHGSFLYAWSDAAGLHYAGGFVIATAIQIVAIYLCNKMLVFR